MSEEYYGIDDSGILTFIGVYDCWDDLEYEVNVDKYVWVWTRSSFSNFLSYGVQLLGDNNV